MKVFHLLGDSARKRKRRLRAAQAAAAGPSYLVRDTFNRADGPIGNAETGQAWIAYYIDDGQDGIVGGEAVSLATNQIDCGATDFDITETVGTFDTTATITFDGHEFASHLGVFALTVDTVTLDVWVNDAETWTAVHLYDAQGLTPPAADGMVLRLVRVGTTITGYRNGVQVFSVAIVPALWPDTPDATYTPTALVGTGNDYTGTTYTAFTVQAVS